MSHDFFFIRADYEGSKKTKEINLHNRKQSWNRFPSQRNKGAHSAQKFLFRLEKFIED